MLTVYIQQEKFVSERLTEVLLRKIKGEKAFGIFFLLKHTQQHTSLKSFMRTEEEEEEEEGAKFVAF